MRDESAADRGRRVARERLKSVGPFYAPLSPSADIPSSFSKQSSGAITNWTVVSLKSEVETLSCINEAKEKELQLLKNQLIESNRLLISLSSKFPESEANAADVKKLVSNRAKGGPLLLESFSNASPLTLSHVLGQMERLLGVKDIDHVEKALVKLASFETRYEELVRACCVLFRTIPKEASHNQLVRQLLAAKAPDIRKDEVKKKSGVAWTFH
jgi:hypothetical protein